MNTMTSEMKHPFFPPQEEVEKLVEPLAALLCCVESRGFIRDQILATVDKRVDEIDQLTRNWIKSWENACKSFDSERHSRKRPDWCAHELNMRNVGCSTGDALTSSGCDGQTHSSMSGA